MKDIKLISPAGFLVNAVLFTLAFALVNAAGLKKYMIVLTGTSPSGGYANVWDVCLAGVYMLAGGMFVVVVPALIIAAIMFGLLLVGGSRGGE